MPKCPQTNAAEVTRMKTKDIGFENDRIERLVKARTRNKRWRVTEAKARLREIIQDAKSGKAQLIGKRDPVILVSVSQLERLMTEFSEPETWGERFFPPVSEEGLGEAIELPARSRSVKDNFDFQGEYADGIATENEGSGRPTPKGSVK